IERYVVPGSNVEKRLGAGQAGRRSRQKLRQGGAVDADCGGKGRLVLARPLQQGGEPRPKGFGEPALVHDAVYLITLDNKWRVWVSETTLSARYRVAASELC